MKKKTYIAKYETTLVTEKSSVSEVKQAKKTASELRKFMKQKALDYFKRTEGVDLIEEVKNSKYDSKIQYKLDEKPTGDIVVEVLHLDKASRGIKATQSFYLSKDRIFAM
jgi:hypothetical protein